MLLFWVSFVACVIGIMLAIIVTNDMTMSDKLENSLSGFSAALIVLGGMIAVIIGFLWIYVTATEMREFETLAYKRDVIDSSINALESNPPDSNSYILRNDLYEEVFSINSRIRKSRRFRDSIWIGGLVNEYFGDLEYIEINGKSPELYFTED